MDIRAVKYFYLVISASLLISCQVSTPVVQIGKDTYMTSSKIGACVNCSAAVKSLEAANEYCAKMGKHVSIRTTDSITNAFGYDVSNRLTFSCLDEKDSDYGRPTLRPDNGVNTIELITK